MPWQSGRHCHPVAGVTESSVLIKGMGFCQLTKPFLLCLIFVWAFIIFTKFVRAKIWACQRSSRHPSPQHDQIVCGQLHYLHIQCTVIWGKGHFQDFFCTHWKQWFVYAKKSATGKSMCNLLIPKFRKKCSEQTAVADWDMTVATICWCASAEASQASSAPPHSCSIPGVGVRGLH